MPIDLKSLRKMESLPSSVQAQPPHADEQVTVMVKLRKGSQRPTYLTERARMGPEIFSADIRAGDLSRLEADPAVESMSLSRPLRSIE